MLLREKLLKRLDKSLSSLWSDFEKGNIMKKTIRSLAVVLVVFSCSSVHAEEEKCRLNIGTSLHPYYSWVKNIVGDAANVSTLIPPGSDPHAYQPVPADMKMLENLDVVVVNGVGHDEFVKPMLKAVENDKLHIVDTSNGLPLIPTFSKHVLANEKNSKVSYNSHTYIAITGAIQQMQMITRKLSTLCPERTTEFIRNVRAYSLKLRKILQSTLVQIDLLNLNNLRIATVHDGYSYLFQELGLEVSAVVQPRHGVKPSARQLQDTIKRIKRAKVNVLFGELDYEKKYVDIIYKETGCRLYALSHISKGKYSAEHFEQTMQQNMNIIVQALSGATGSMMLQELPGLPKNVSQQVSEQMTGKMLDKVKENIQKKVPEMQSKKMSERMTQKIEDTARKMQDTVEENLRQVVPEMQSKQIEDTARQVEDSVKKNLEEIMPEVQQQKKGQ
ncbi:MAG: hypothetical protein D3923_01790 [Candidatus Electrothrix sp. AR3]|nr:hypothetical protein [Candidatus Electrothrix sp. AR3]